jgi:hypothetical protein
MVAAVLSALLDNKSEEEASSFAGPNPGTYGKGDKDSEDKAKEVVSEKEEDEKEGGKIVPAASTDDIMNTVYARCMVLFVTFHAADILLCETGVSPIGSTLYCISPSLYYNFAICPYRLY